MGKGETNPTESGMDTELKNLFRLLDDESEQSASMAMAGILERTGSRKLDEILRRLQESGDQRLRRRVHQLQSIMTLRRRRRLLAQRLESRNIDLLEGLVQMHMLWYDNDSEDATRREWNAFMEESKSFKPSNMERLAYFMRKKGFSCPSKDDIEADYYCLGTILEEAVGADFMLCMMAKLAADAWGVKTRIAQMAGDFALVDEHGFAAHAANDWKIVPNVRKGFREWDAHSLLKLNASMLFICGMSTDSFRYVQTVGSCLSKACGAEGGVENLPYPYGGKAAAKA